MNNYVQKILANANINDVNSINSYIDNLSISVNSKRMYVYWICKYMNELGLDTSKIAKYEQVFVTKKNDLTFEEIQKIKTKLWDDEINFVFNALLDTGMRVQEFVSVDWQNLDQSSISIKTIKNKNEYRNVFLLNETFDALLKLQKQNFDFSKINIKRIQYLLSKLGKDAELTISLSPHVLRRTKGSLLRMNGAALEDIADILGHKKLDTTRKYYSKLNQQYMKSVSELAKIKPCESLEVQKLLAENKLLKKEIILLQQEIARLRNQE